MEKKRRHHYIFRAYLKAWSSNDKICCEREGKTFQSNLMGIGQERDFYKLRNFNTTDLSFIKEMINPAQPHLQELHNNLLKPFCIIFDLQKIIENTSISCPEIQEILDVVIHNFEEDLHGYIEDKGKTYLELLYKNDTSFFKSDIGVREFAEFLLTQYMRTKKCRDNIYSRIQHISKENPIFECVEKTWNFLSHVFAANLAWDIYANRKNYKLLLLINESKINFITGDQPVISTLEEISDDKIELYYPISPRLAILLTQEDINQEAVILSELEIVKYNNLIRDNSHEQIYFAA